MPNNDGQFTKILSKVTKCRFPKVKAIQDHKGQNSLKQTYYKAALFVNNNCNKKVGRKVIYDVLELNRSLSTGGTHRF